MAYIVGVSQAATLRTADVFEVVQQFGITRSSLQAQLRMAEGEGELDEEPTLNALRALLIILERAEGGA